MKSIVVAGLSVMLVSTEAPPSFAQIRKIVTDRCLFCHSAVAQEDGLNPSFQAPKGITFDTPQQIVKFAPLIEAYSVASQAMPPGNATKMTDAERSTIGAWISHGASLGAD